MRRAGGAARETPGPGGLVRTRSMEVPGGMLRGVRAAQNWQEPTHSGARPTLPLG